MADQTKQPQTTQPKPGEQPKPQTGGGKAGDPRTGTDGDRDGKTGEQPTR